MLRSRAAKEVAIEKTIRVRLTRGVLEPLETVDLSEGRKVTITILVAPSELDAEAFRRSHGGWKGTVDADARIRDIDADRRMERRSR